MSGKLQEALSGSRGADQKRIAETGVEWIETILSKNADYGSSVFEVPELAPECNADAAIRVRMSDKINRIRSLLKRPPEVSGESLTDSMRDLGAYCLLWLARPSDSAQWISETEVDLDVRAEDLRQVPANDDDEPITEEWAKTILTHPFKGGWCWKRDSVACIWRRPDGNLVLGDGHWLRGITTRGELRMLVELLSDKTSRSESLLTRS